MAGTDHTEAAIETPTQQIWRRIAWNGIRFSAPANWEIGRIGMCYLQLESETGPAVEVKWNRIKGRFSHKRHLRRLAGLQKRKLRKSFRQAAMPASWENALQDRVAAGFAWQTETIGGRGVLVYSPASRTATLLQFYSGRSGDAERSAPRLLASFRDHVSGSLMPLAVFDIRAQIPIEYELQRFRFEIGRYDLRFSARNRKLRMIRWSPAAVLLRRQDLRTMAQDCFHPKGKRPIHWLRNDAARVEGEVAPSSVAARIASKIRRRPAYRFFRLWHEVEKNRILGVHVSGSHPVDRRQFAAICETYETR